MGYCTLNMIWISGTREVFAPKWYFGFLNVIKTLSKKRKTKGLIINKKCICENYIYYWPYTLKFLPFATFTL